MASSALRTKASHIGMNLFGPRKVGGSGAPPHFGGCAAVGDMTIDKEDVAQCRRLPPASVVCNVVWEAGRTGNHVQHHGYLRGSFQPVRVQVTGRSSHVWYVRRRVAS